MFYSFACIGVRLLLRLFTRCNVEGLEFVPREGPFLLISNHLSMIDPPVLGALLSRRITFMAKEEAFRHPFLGPIVRWYGAFAVKRGRPDRQALRTAMEVLRAGGVVGMFPEGHRSKTGRLNKAFAGSAMVARMAGVPILPVAIVGTDRVRSPLSLLRRPAITLRVGRLFFLKKTEKDGADLDVLTTEMMMRIAHLLPEEMRGYYAQRPTGPDAGQ